MKLQEFMTRFAEFSPEIIIASYHYNNDNDNDLKNILLEQSFLGIAPLDMANHQQISFLTNLQYIKDLKNTKAFAVIINHSDYLSILELGKIPHFDADNNFNPNHLIFIKVPKNAYALFAKLQQYFHPLFLNSNADLTSIQTPIHIHPTAIIHPSVQIAQGVRIDAFVVIEEGVHIDQGTHIGAHCHIAKNSQIGELSTLYPNVQIYHGTHIGKRVIIHSGSVIGSDGFGFAPYFTANENAWLKIPQIGYVLIEDDVEIGANCSIDRAAFNYTKIGYGTKLDNLIQIAHNVEIGAHCVVAGCTAIAGSTRIGDFCMIGGSSQLAGHLVIADKTTISGATSIMHSILETGQHYTGVYPALPHALWKRLAAYLRRLIKKKP